MTISRLSWRMHAHSQNVKRLHWIGSTEEVLLLNRNGSALRAGTWHQAVAVRHPAGPAVTCRLAVVDRHKDWDFPAMFDAGQPITSHHNVAGEDSMDSAMAKKLLGCKKAGRHGATRPFSSGVPQWGLRW